MPELGVSVGVVPTLLDLPIALEAVPLVMQKLGDLHMADRMLLPAQDLGQRAGTLAYPPQW